VLRIVGENRLDSQHVSAGALSFEGGVGLDGLDQSRDALPVTLREKTLALCGEVLPGPPARPKPPKTDSR
jgi:hypothetical protein